MVAVRPAVARSGALFGAQLGEGKQPAYKSSRRVPLRLPACPATRRFLLDQGRRRLEVTLRDGVPLWPSSEPGDRLARDRPGFTLAGLKPHEIKGLPYPKPHRFGDVVDAQGPAPGRSPVKAALPKSSCINACVHVRVFYVCKGW